MSEGAVVKLVLGVNFRVLTSYNMDDLRKTIESENI